MKQTFVVKAGSRLTLCAGALVAAATLAGCSMGTIQLSGTATDTAAVKLTGSVHGGQQGVSSSTVALYAVGLAGYGSASTSLLTTPVTTDKFGSFGITNDYTCPTPSTLVYLTATGGNPGLAAGTNNTAIKLVAALGACGNLSANTYITVNEVSTAAAAFALGQYFGASTAFGSNAANNSGDSFGGPNTSQGLLGISNAFATVNNLVTLATGAAVTSAPVAGSAGTLTMVPEAAKLYTIADILASCINSASSSSTACATLLADTPPTGKTAANTLEAAVYLSLNPTSTNNASGTTASNIAALYGLESATSPFQASGATTLTAAPTDWTLGILYQDLNSGGLLFQKPQNLAVDGYGNVWVLSNNGGVGSLVELSNTGVPVSNISSLSEYGPFTSPVASPPVLSSPKNTTTTFTTQNTVFTTTFGASPASGNNAAINPRNLAIDPSNNVWFTQSSGTSSGTGGSNGATSIPVSGAVFEIPTSAGLPTGSTYGFSTGKSAYGLAIDGAGDVFVGQQSSSAYFSLYEFPFNATPGAGLLTPIAYPIATATAGTAGTSGTNSYYLPEYMAFDTSGNLWIDGGSGSASYNFTVKLGNINTSSCGTLTANSLCQVTTSTSLNTYNTYTLTGSPTEPWQPAAGSGVMFIADALAGNSVNLVTSLTAGTNTQVGNTATFTLPHYLAVDGAGNAWVANSNGTPGGTGATAGGSLSELSSTGSILSPATTSTTTVNPGYVHSGLNFGAGTAIDPSGNVWVANNAAFVAASGTTPAVPSSVFELVGAAAPTVTPIATALANNTVAAKP